MDVPVESNSSGILECGTSLAEHEHRQEGFSTLLSAETDTGFVQSVESLRSIIASDVVVSGKDYTTFDSPFEVPPGVSNPSGRRFLQLPLVYCDQTASNRSVQSIERYMERVCLPLYGNTHTNTSITGSQSTAFVAEARQIVAEETNAKITGKASQDVVLFAGNGTTSAVELLIDCLGLKHASSEPATRPVVFVGPYEHHSNLIPWRETGCEIVMVPECSKQKQVDIEALELLLQRPNYKNRIKMGTFTAASNVTGKISDVDRIAATLHRHGALAFFDYATGAPYMKMDMNPPPTEEYPSPAMTAKDAIFFSPHKMLGGVGTPGVLIVKKHLVSQVNAPHRSGGGTVFYVTNTHHRFLGNRIERYEGGTPNVAGIVRVGLAFLMKRKIDERFGLAVQNNKRSDPVTTAVPRSVEVFDCTEYERISAFLKERAPNLVLLGRDEGGRNLPIFSFLVRFGQRFLHYNYICAILNDVFGIQSRGGCQCAGPYSQRLLGLTTTTSAGQEEPNLQNKEIESALIKFKERAELLRPGYTRLSLPFKGLRSEEIEYVLKALVWTAENGWALMCNYRCNHRTGEWRHSSRQGKPLGRDERKWLSHFDFLKSSSFPDENRNHANLRKHLDETLSSADALLRTAKSDQRTIMEALKMTDADDVLGKDDDACLESLRWYVYPKECASVLAAKLEHLPEENLPLAGALNPGCGDHCSSQDLKRTCEAMDTGAGDATSILMGVSSDVLFFRDGEYTGEATGEDISAGIDDGELSEMCEVFDQVSGVWVRFFSLDRGPKKLKNEETSEALVSGVADTSGTKNQSSRKKACRDNQAWGKGSIVPHSASIPGQDNVVVKSVYVDQNQGPQSTNQKSLLGKKSKFKHVKPPAKMMRHVTQAIVQWDMLQDGDRLLLGLSGGKDSLSLLHCLLESKRRLPINFELEVCTIDPMTPSFDPSPLIPYVESLGLKYHYIRDDIVSRASSSGKNGKTVSSLCAYCARMKRGNLYACARKNKCNKLVLAQHLDDCAESFVMSFMHNGFLRTMKANYKIDAGDVSVIRPLVYCRESLMTDFAKTANLPVINENCPACFEEPKERARVKKLLSREETLFPNFYDNIRRSLIPLMHDDTSRILRSYTEEVVSKSRTDKKSYSDRKETKRGNGMEEVLSLHESGGAKEGLDATFSQASDEALILELARRRADRFRSSDDAKRSKDDFATEIPDPTGQVCSLIGGNGTIPCRELME